VTAPAVARRWREPPRCSAVEAAIRTHAVALRRRAPLAALLATGLAVHAGAAPHLAVRGLAPDALLVAVVAVAAGRGERAGAAFGFAAGLGTDLFLATPLGTAALAYTLVGHLLGRSSQRAAAARRAALRQSIVLVFVGVAAGRLGTAAVATALGGVPFPETAGLLRMAGVAALSAPLGPPAVAVVRRLGRPSGARR
jgi:rod shape-determining protein MreD